MATVSQQFFVYIKMIRNVQIISLNQTVKELEQISELFRKSIGPDGKSVLFEKNGQIWTTKDGTEILSFLSVTPQVQPILNRMASFHKVHSDGSKRYIMLAAYMLRSLMNIEPVGRPDNLRSSILAHLNVLLHILAKVKTQFPTMTQRITLDQAIHANISPKFSPLITKELVRVVGDYLSKEFPTTLQKPKHFEELVVKVPNVPIFQSKVIDGFIITRDFKYLHKETVIFNGKLILWNLKLENEDSEQVTGDTCEGFMKAYFHTYEKFKKFLQSISIDVIISSVFFPSWAQSVCTNLGISIIDMVYENEMKTLERLYSVGIYEFHETPVIHETTLTRFYLGTCKYVKMHTRGSQIVLTSLTPTQTSQYAYQCSRTIQHLAKWFQGASLSDLVVPAVPIGSSAYIQIDSILDGIRGETKVLRQTIRSMVKSLANDEKVYRAPEDNVLKENPLFTFELLKDVILACMDLVRLDAKITKSS